MEGQRHHGRASGPPRIPTDIRNSAVENHFAKSQASGRYQLRRATARRRSASSDWLPKQEPPPGPPTKAVSTPSSKGGGGGRGENGQTLPQPVPPTEGEELRPPPPPPPPLVPSGPRSSSLLRSASADEMSTGGNKSPIPSLMRRVSASASPRGSSGGRGGEGGEAFSSSNCNSDSRKVRLALAATSERIDNAGSNENSESNSKSNSKNSFFEYWSYSSRRASISRSATSEIADDFLSADDTISAPVPSTTTTAQPTAPKGMGRGVSDDKNGSAAASENERARAAGESARAARAAAAVAERREKDAKLRLEELRKHSGNRYDLCGPFAARGRIGGGGRGAKRHGGVGGGWYFRPA